jgi:hypothetical protein
MPTYVIVQPGYATGDMFGIAATLVLDADARVIVTHEALGARRDPTDRGPQIADFLRASLPALQRLTRVVLVEVSSIRQNTKGDKTLIDNAARPLLAVENITGSVRRNRMKGVGEGTTVIAAKWNGGSRDALRTAWGVVNYPEVLMGQWLAARGIPKTGTSAVILWSRFSGKKGDIHLEHDTSFEGTRELVALALKTNDVVFIAGDKPIKPTQQGKFRELAEAYRGKVFDITAFWENLGAFGGWCVSRMDQFKLYEYLHHKFVDARHLGFRSGNLEAMAMLGYTVRYLEEPGSVGSDRMEKWRGKGIGYERIQVSRPPTRSGQFLLKTIKDAGKDGYKDVKRPSWAPGRPGATPKPLEIQTDYAKGFAREDFEALDAYLNPPAQNRAQRAVPPFRAMVTAQAGGITVSRPVSALRMEMRFQLGVLMGVSPMLTLEQLTRAFRQFSLTHHWDKSHNEEKSKKWMMANELLQQLKELTQTGQIRRLEGSSTPLMIKGPTE